MQVQKGMGPVVRRRKRPLSACYNRRKCSIETSHKSVKGRVSVEILLQNGKYESTLCDLYVFKCNNACLYGFFFVVFIPFYNS